MEDTYNDVWCIDMTEIAKIANGTVSENENIWVKIATKGDGPGKISNHSGVAIENRIYIYGGLIENENVKNSLYFFDTQNYTWFRHITKVILRIIIDRA